MASWRTDKLHFVVACSDKKRRSAGEPARLRDVHGRNVQERCERWRAALETASPVRARDLYAGDHWSTACSLPEVAADRGVAARLWVASAGVGLIDADVQVRPYSATFAMGHPDSVDRGDGIVDPVRWWEALARRPWGERGHPASLTALARRADANARIVVVASASYIRAMAEDLGRASAAIGTERLLLVTAAPGPADPALAPSWVPSGERLQAGLGGALTSLHVRVARALVADLGGALSATGARTLVERLARQSAPIVRPNRERSDDQAVLAFIRKHLQGRKPVSHTTLLREYRAAGFACEQKRFRDLFVDEERK